MNLIMPVLQAIPYVRNIKFTLGKTGIHRFYFYLFAVDELMIEHKEHALLCPATGVYFGQLPRVDQLGAFIQKVRTLKIKEMLID